MYVLSKVSQNIILCKEEENPLSLTINASLLSCNMIYNSQANKSNAKKHTN